MNNYDIIKSSNLALSFFSHIAFIFVFFVEPSSSVPSVSPKLSKQLRCFTDSARRGQLNCVFSFAFCFQFCPKSYGHFTLVYWVTWPPQSEQGWDVIKIVLLLFSEPCFPTWSSLHLRKLREVHLGLLSRFYSETKLRSIHSKIVIFIFLET